MNKKTIARVIELFDSGDSLREIADKTGTSMASASRILHANDRSAWNRRYPHTEGRDEDAMIQDYQNYMPVEQILRKYHIGQTTLYRRLREREIVTRPRKPSMKGKKNPQYKHGKGSRYNEREAGLAKQVVAICLGKVVPRRWHIHHIDENPENNQPRNLALFQSNRDHMRYHQQLLSLQREGAQADANQLVLGNGGILLPTPDHPLTFPHETDRLFPQRNQEKTKKGPGE